MASRLRRVDVAVATGASAAMAVYVLYRYWQWLNTTSFTKTCNKLQDKKASSKKAAPKGIEEREHGGICPACNNRFSQLVRHMKKCQAVLAMSSAKGGLCPGCNSTFPNLFKHMRRCCPEKLERSDDHAAIAEHRKEQSPDDWLDAETVAEAARISFASMSDPLQRRALELRFGLDQGGKRRTPAEVGEVLGGKYAANPQTAQVLIRTAMNSIPLVADDPEGLQVLYEDEELLAVAKPPFLRSTPVHRFCGQSLTNMLVGYLKPNDGAPPPYIIHRLDQCTSGVFLCTKTSTAAATLQAIWHGQDCSKEYLALVHVLPQSSEYEVGRVFEVDAPIGRSSQLVDDVKRVVDPKGQTAKTRFCILARGKSTALLSAELVESGRTHQIRVHASHIGFPLIGDGLYGGEERPDKAHINRVALHAWRLSIVHPTSAAKMLITAPLPEDMQASADAHEVRWSG